MIDALYKFKSFDVRDITSVEKLNDTRIYPLKVSFGRDVYKVSHSTTNLSGKIGFMNTLSFVPRIYDMYSKGDDHYYLTSYIDNIRCITMSDITTEKYYCMLVDSIGMLNEQGIYHDDLDDENVFITSDGELHIIDMDGFCFRRADQRTYFRFISGDHYKGTNIPLHV